VRRRLVGRSSSPHARKRPRRENGAGRRGGGETGGGEDGCVNRQLLVKETGVGEGQNAKCRSKRGGKGGRGIALPLLGVEWAGSLGNGGGTSPDKARRVASTHSDTTETSSPSSRANTTRPLHRAGRDDKCGHHTSLSPWCKGNATRASKGLGKLLQAIVIVPSINVPKRPPPSLQKNLLKLS
jgi:hypothetical protein